MRISVPTLSSSVAFYSTPLKEDPRSYFCRGPLARWGLEVEPDLSRQSARRDVVRAAEGGKEVVQGVFVSDS